VLQCGINAGSDFTGLYEKLSRPHALSIHVQISLAGRQSMNLLAWVTNGVIVVGTLVVAGFLWRPVMRSSRLWRATVTPLASIVGSGFLVVAPLLGYTVGNWAVVAMLGIVALAYAVGAAVRYNIGHVEQISDSKESDGALFVWLERAAKISLAIAYIIAITFYLELLAAFVLRLFDVQDQGAQKLIATGLIVFIGGFGFWRGLERLESLETYSVDTKLAIIAGFLVGLAVVNLHGMITGAWRLSEMPVEWNVETVRKLAGAFLIVQGFETSRYMGSVYGAQERIRTMRYAQLLAGVIYLVFITLATVLLDSFSSISETGIISLSARVAIIVPSLLIVGAAMAQFSAAVADTLASGGLVEAATYGNIKHRIVYPAVMLLAVALLWSSHILSIIAYASRAFAAYYAIQCAMAALHSGMAQKGERSFSKMALFALLSIVMVLVALFGIPAESLD
jgi:hypothetical protein